MSFGDLNQMSRSQECQKNETELKCVLSTSSYPVEFKLCKVVIMLHYKEHDHEHNAFISFNNFSLYMTCDA